jgi:hypothetical protein
MELRPSLEAASCTATQELSSILGNPKVHYCVHNSPPLDPLLSHINPVHTTPSYLSKIHFNIIHDSPPTSAEVKKMWIYTSTPLYVFMA